MFSTVIERKAAAVKQRLTIDAGPADLKECPSTRLRVLVFAHIPPPFHGQSYMVKLMLDGLRTDPEKLQIYHVNAKLSGGVEAIGRFQWAKVFLLLKYCFQAWWYRIARQADTFYYIPAPGKR